MATSADKLSQILNTLAATYGFTQDDALKTLAKQELLPQKLIPKAKSTSLFASTKAEELAAEHGIVPEGKGSGKDNRHTMADIEKLLAKPAKKLLISPKALKLANKNGLDVTKISGSGAQNRIILADVEKIVDGDDGEEDLNITEAADDFAEQNGITDCELKSIKGSGKENSEGRRRILLGDVKEYHSSGSDGSCKGGKKKKEPKKKAKKEESESESESDSEEEE